MMYIKDPLQTDAGNNNGSPDSDSWINKIIFSNTTLSHFTRQLIVSDFIRLQIVKNSIDFNNLVSIMPSFQNTPTPCIVFIFSGQIIDIFPTDIDVNIVDDKIKTIHSNLQNISGKINAQQSIPSHSSPYIHRSEQQQQQQQQTPVSSVPLASVQHQSAQTSDVSLNNNTTNIPAVSTNSNITNAKNKSQQSKKSLKEESAEVAALKYKENLLKQQKQAKLDRERILNLLNLDRKEQKNKEKEKNLGKKNLSIDEIHVHENLHNSKIQNSSTYTIQLKLLDGSTIRHNFKSTDKLLNVRNYVLEAYPDYNSFPFYFFKNIDRITFGEADENKTLLLLDLNRSTLILKPVEPEESQNVSVAADNHNASTFGWLKNKMYSYLWSSESNQNNSFSHDNRSIPTPIPQATTDHQSYTSSLSAHTQIEDESDCDTVYHTPLLGSTTPSTSSLRPTMSSFNLYGSQGLIQPVSLSSSTHDLSNPTIDYQQQQEQHQEQQQEQQSTLNEVLQQSGQHLGQQTDEESRFLTQNNDRSLRNVRNVDDMDVNNGNSISLQFPDDK